MNIFLILFFSMIGSVHASPPTEGSQEPIHIAISPQEASDMKLDAFTKLLTEKKRTDRQITIIQTEIGWAFTVIVGMGVAAWIIDTSQVLRGPLTGSKITVVNLAIASFELSAYLVSRPFAWLKNWGIKKFYYLLNNIQTAKVEQALENVKINGDLACQFRQANSRFNLEKSVIDSVQLEKKDLENEDFSFFLRGEKLNSKTWNLFNSKNKQFYVFQKLVCN